MSYSPRRLRDKDSNLDLRVQSAVSWPLDDPGRKRSVVHATRPRFDPGSQRPQWLPRVIVEAFWSPALASRWKKRRQNQPSNIQRHLPRSARRGPFSLRRGLDSVPGFLQAEHHLVCCVLICLQTTRATLSGRPRFELPCRQGTSGSTSERGPGYRRTAASRTAPVGTTRPPRHTSRPS